MSYIMVVVLGVIQGVAEFLPISSSGHLTLFQHFFGMSEPDNLFNILLHFATLIAVCVYYWRDIWEMILEFFRFFGDLFSRTPSRGEPPAARRQILLLIVATLPLFLVLPIKDKVEAVGNYPAAVSCILLLTGVVLFTSDRMAKGRKNARNTTLLDALLIGVAQGFPLRQHHRRRNGPGAGPEVCRPLLLPHVPARRAGGHHFRSGGCGPGGRH